VNRLEAARACHASAGARLAQVDASWNQNPSLVHLRQALRDALQLNGLLIDELAALGAAAWRRTA
jgi:hypothetical protein